MKSIIWASLFVTMLLSGCANTETPQSDDKTWQPTIKSFDVNKLLDLRENREYAVFDYQDNVVLVLIADRSKRNPLDINDQTVTTFYESFVLFDLSSKTVKEEFPIQKFGICPSALMSFEGVVFSFFEVSPDRELNSSIQFIDDFGMQSIYDGDFSPFGMGPVLQHYDNAVLCSYLERECTAFGVMKLTKTFESEPVLHFRTEGVDYISDDFKASEVSYAYTIGNAGKVTFYVGTSAGTTNRISLPKGRKIHSFDVTSEVLIVSLAATDKNNPAGIQIFDLSTGELILEQVDSMPSLYSISVNEQGQMCGFSFSPNVTPSRPHSLKLYSLKNQVEEIAVDTSAVSGSFFKTLSNEKNFLAAAYGYEQTPEFWVVSSND